MERDSGSQKVAGTCDNTSDRFRKEAMSTETRTGQKSSGTDRKYKFQDQHEEPAIIPDSWAEEAVHEDGDGERFFAVEIRLGQRLEYTVDRNGQPIKGPHHDEPGMQAMYVTADGGRAVVIESKAVRSDGSIVPRNDWRSVLVDPDADVGTVKAERRDAYRALVRELYEVDN